MNTTPISIVVIPSHLTADPRAALWPAAAPLQFSQFFFPSIRHLPSDSRDALRATAGLLISNATAAAHGTDHDAHTRHFRHPQTGGSPSLCHF